jgi:hypothetical protein
MRPERSGPASMNPSAVMQPLDCANKVRFSLSDETGVLRFTSFDIVDVGGFCEIVETLQEYLVSRPLADVDVDYLRKLTCTGNGECLHTVIQMVEEYQQLFVR